VSLAEQDKAELRRQRQAELHSDIMAGRIDVGPKPEHAHVERDIRDMRDPTALGNAIARKLASGDCEEASDAADFIDKRVTVRRSPASELMGDAAARTYQSELKRRAEAGDRFAISVLTTGKPGDSDE